MGARPPIHRWLVARGWHWRYRRGRRVGVAVGLECRAVRPGGRGGGGGAEWTWRLPRPEAPRGFRWLRVVGRRAVSVGSCLAIVIASVAVQAPRRWG